MDPRSPADPLDHVDTVRQQIINDLKAGSSPLVDTFTHMRDAMDLVTNGLFSLMEYNASTIVASKHQRRAVVLNRCTEQAKADLKKQVENSKYNDPGTFGEMPLFSCPLLASAAGEG